MSWEEEYHAKRKDAEDLADEHIENLKRKVTDLEKELKHRHRKAVLLSWLAVIAVVAFEVWHYYPRK